MFIGTWASENRPIARCRSSHSGNVAQRIARLERGAEPNLVVGEEEEDRGRDAEASSNHCRHGIASRARAT